MFKVILVFLFFLQVAGAQDIIKSRYPFFRQFRAGFNVTFGLASFIKGNKVITDDEASTSEKNIGTGMMLIGALRMGDGFYYFANHSPVEELLKEGKLDPTFKDYKKYLREAAAFEKKLRTYRGTVILINGLTFGLLYNEDRDKYDYAWIPAAGMMIVGAYAIFKKGPAEMQLDLYQKRKVSFNLNYRLIDKKLAPFAELTYKF